MGGGRSGSHVFRSRHDVIAIDAGARARLRASGY